MTSSRTHSPAGAHRPDVVSRTAASPLQIAADHLVRSLNVGREDAAVVFTAGPSDANRSMLLDHARDVAAPTRYLISTNDRVMLAQYTNLLAPRGIGVQQLRLTADGTIDLRALDEELRSGASLISVDAVQRETGVMQPLMAIASRARRHGAVLHLDATHAWGFVPLSPANIGADAVTVSADVERGAESAGALVRFGAGRGGGVALGAVSHVDIDRLGEFASVRSRQLPNEIAPIRALQRRLERGVVAAVHGSSVIGSSVSRSPWISSFRLPGVDTIELLNRMPLLETWTAEPGAPATLGAMGHTADEIASALRIELRPGITQRDLDALLAQLDFAINGGSA